MADLRYSGSEQEHKESHLLRNAAMIGGSILAYRNRQTIGRIASEVTSNTSLLASRALAKDTQLTNSLSDLKLLMSGVSDALGDNPSVLRTIRASYDENIQNKMRRDFESSIRNNIEKRHLASTYNRPGTNKTEFGSTFYTEFHQRDHYNLNKFQHKATQAFRDDKVANILRNDALIKQFGADQVVNAFSHYSRQNRGMYSDPTEHAKAFVQQLENGTFKHKVNFIDNDQRQAFQNTLQTTLEAHSDVGKVFKANEAVITKRANAFESASAYGFIKKAMESTSLLEKSLKSKGFRGITLNDVEHLDESSKRKLGLIVDDIDQNENRKSIDVTKELRKFLDSNQYNDELNRLLKTRGNNFDFSNIKLDSHILIHDGTGEVLDNRHLREGAIHAVDKLQSSVKVPFLNINPVDLTPWQSIRSGQAKEGLQLLRAGEVHGFAKGLDGQTFDGAPIEKQAGAIRNPLNNSNHFYTGGNLFRYTDQGGLELVDENLYLVSSQYGPFSRAHQNMTNYTGKETEDQRGWLKKLFDLGHQEGESRLTTYKKAWDKLSDPMYGPNALRGMVYDLYAGKAEDQAELVKNVYGVLRVGIERNARSLTRETTEFLAPEVNKIFKDVQVHGKAFDFARLSDDDYVKDAALAFNKVLKNEPNRYTRSAYRVGTGLENRETKINEAVDPSVSELQKWTKFYIKDPEGFNSSRQIEVARKLPSVFDTLSPINEDQALIPAVEKMRRSFHQYALRALDAEAGDFSPDLVKNGVRQRSSIGLLNHAKNMGVLSDSDIKTAKDLELLTDLLSYKGIHNTESKPFEAKTFLEDIINISAESASFDDRKIVFNNANVQLTDLGMDLQEGILRAQPKFGRAPEAGNPSLNNSDFIIMRKNSLGQKAKDYIADINANIIQSNNKPVDKAWDFLIDTENFVKSTGKELFAGRHRKGDNLQDVTTSTLITYGLAERLDNQLTNFGLGLSRQNLGSFQSIMGNQYLRRIVLPYVAYQQAVYFDGLTGDSISDTAADAYVGTHETLTGIKDFLQINKAMRPWANVFKSSGFDQVGEWVGVKQLDFLTFGAFSDFRSTDEVREYYESGEDPVRKNRYWGIGSPSPWAGGGIDHYEANWYRKLKSDYKFTDTMYGSEDEYWANNWMPTLTHPFAPIKHFLTDPYHYEKKHEKDRPYAVTGGFSELQNIPIIGSLVDGTVGRILKPRKEHEGLEKAHKEYVSAINNYIRSQYDGARNGVGVSVSGTGSIDLRGAGGASGPTYGADAGIVNYDGVFSTTGSFGGGSGNGEGGYYGDGGYYGSGGSFGLDAFGVFSGGYRAGSGILFGGNSGNGARRTKDDIARQNYALALSGQGGDLRPVDSLHKIHNPGFISDLSSADRIDDLKGLSLDAFYSASELAGIYGFLTKTGLSYDESWRGTTLATSNQMTSYNRAFWDMNLGGLGGSLSEIGRRYVPRDPNKDYYSPIRNTMPDWLPGVENNIDFLHGDPYAKLQHGEMRLPGAAYERLYKLHPDGTGTGDFANYGIFDRFRILADVAPNTRQYKMAKMEVTKLREADGMTNDMEKEFDEIVGQVASRKDTRRFYDKKFSHADIQEKTVTVTQVLDANTFMTREFDTPIKLAGLDLTAKNEDVTEWLSQFIKTGAKLKIGIADDPVARYNKDTYNTISAVVYAPKNEEGRFWFETTKGQSLNSMIANRTWGSEVTIKDDGSPTATRALYSNDMVTVGKYTEMLTHDILPKVPFLGILADKFLQVRTPIEQYKREEIYGKNFKPWTEPINSWIKPMLNTVASQNPLLAGAELAAIGHMFGKTGTGQKIFKNQGIGRVAGFIIGAGLASARVFADEATNILPGGDSVWLPESRRKEREINEYFDRLKYVKYRGLYEEASRLAKEREGVDVNEFFDRANEKGKKNKGLKRFLETKKKWLNMAKKTGYGDAEVVDSKIDNLSAGLKDIESGKEAYSAGKYAGLAIQYRKEYESTLYAMDEGADYETLMRALTPKDREFVPKFLESTSTKERNEILKYVPNDVKRILQGKWGLKVDKREDINEYFKTHNLPNQNWEGWSASANLDDIKIKVMKKEGVRPTEAGYWGKDEARAEQHGATAIPIHSLSGGLDTDRLRKVLAGAGLSDVDVQLTTSYGDGPGGINTSINVTKDVSNEIIDTINANIHGGLF